MLYVACAIIEKDGKVLAAQRSLAMALPLKWEFPGGKQEAGESGESCIKREIKEELNLDIHLIARLPDEPYFAGSKPLTLIPFVCKCIEGEIILAEHAAIRWLNPTELESLDWAEADIPVVKSYLRYLNSIER